MRGVSLRQQLLWGILLPVLFLVALNTISLYREALAAINTAYDRTLLASAKAISEQIEVKGYDEAARFGVRVPYAALEAFETDNQSRMYYKVSSLEGQTVSGYEDLPAWHGKIPMRPAYAALVDFYHDAYRGQPVRVAAVLQPVASPEGRGVALIQVAETLELREALAREILFDTLWRQSLLVLVIAAVVFWVVQRVIRPVRDVSRQLEARPENDLTPIAVQNAPRELRPLIHATNVVMGKLAHLLEHQKRFVRDTSHQLRTPLAVLKTQVQSALRGDQAPELALQDILHTVDRATRMANQMLALAKVEQLREQALTQHNRLDTLVRNVALDLAPLVAERDIDFGIDTQEVSVRAHEWMLNELARNLLHNAIKHTPASGQLHVSVHRRGDDEAVLEVCNDGPGIPQALRARMFEPFVAAGGQQGAGLGLAICHSIVEALGGRIAVQDWHASVDAAGPGVAVSVVLPLKPSRP
jgi:two-component system sensor histidine kinase TctE